MNPAKTLSDDANARRISRRSAFLGGGFILTAAVAAMATPRRHERTIGDARLADLVPPQVGPWGTVTGEAMILPEDDQIPDVYDQVFTRSFYAPGLPSIMLLIAYGAAQSGIMKVHRPEICYASSGFSIQGDKPVDIHLDAARTIAAKSFLATRADRAEHVLYWTRISTAFPRDLNAQRLVVMERGLRGVIPDGVLVRCSTTGGDPRDQQSTLGHFAQTLVASVGARGRALLIGAAPQTAGR